MLSIPTQIWILGSGGLPAATKWYWHDLLRAQLLEVKATFGTPTPLKSFAEIEKCRAPGVVIVPVLAGGCVVKRDWLAFRRALRDFQRRGGIVLILAFAFCLPEEGKKARGRHFEGVETSGGENWMDHPVSFDSIPATLTYGFQVEHNLRPDADSRIEVIAKASTATTSRPLAIRFSEPATEIPGAMLFLNTWGWARAQIEDKPRSEVARLHRPSVEGTFVALRDINRRLLGDSLTWVQMRVSERMTRLETMAGENQRLSRNMGSEKDYHRLLANDVDLCVDVLGWRALVGAGDPQSTRLRTRFKGGWVWVEPPHYKGATAKGRLDLLLFPENEGPDGGSLTSLSAWLKAETKTPVAWVELEAGEFHTSQMDTFFHANRALLRTGDFICAVDRSLDDAPAVMAFRKKVESAGLTFIHAQIPTVFNRLEEHYAPEMHRLSRKRFTTEIIRGLIG